MKSRQCSSWVQRSPFCITQRALAARERPGPSSVIAAAGGFALFLLAPGLHPAKALMKPLPAAADRRGVGRPPSRQSGLIFSAFDRTIRISTRRSCLS